MCVIPEESTLTERSFSCIVQIKDWFRNGLLKGLLGNLAITAVRVHTIRILKADICNACTSICTRRMTASLLIGN